MKCKNCKTKMCHSKNLYHDIEVEIVEYECPRCEVKGWETTYKAKGHVKIQEYFIGTKEI